MQFSIRIRKWDADILEHLGLAYTFGGHHELAEECLLEALKINPSHCFAMVNLALNQFKQNLVDESLETLSKAREVDANNTHALLLFGYICLCEDMLDKAQYYLELCCKQFFGTLRVPKSVKGAAYLYLCLVHHFAQNPLTSINSKAMETFAMGIQLFQPLRRIIETRRLSEISPFRIMHTGHLGSDELLLTLSQASVLLVYAANSSLVEDMHRNRRILKCSLSDSFSGCSTRLSGSENALNRSSDIDCNGIVDGDYGGEADGGVIDGDSGGMKDSDCGGIRDGSIRNGNMRDGSMRDGGIRDGSIRDGGVRDDSMRHGSIRDGGMRNDSLRDGGVRDSGMRDGGVRDVGMRDGCLRDVGMKDGRMSDGGVRDGGVRDSSIRDGGIRDDSVREDGIRDGGVRDDGMRDGDCGAMVGGDPLWRYHDEENRISRRRDGGKSLVNSRGVLHSYMSDESSLSSDDNAADLLINLYDSFEDAQMAPPPSPSVSPDKCSYSDSSPSFSGTCVRNFYRSRSGPVYRAPIYINLAGHATKLSIDQRRPATSSASAPSVKNISTGGTVKNRHGGGRRQSSPTGATHDRDRRVSESARLNKILSSLARRVEAVDARQITCGDLVTEECLGSGVFGVVWRGLCLKESGQESGAAQKVAIKKLYIEESAIDALKSLRTEVELINALRHPRLVTFVGVCFDYPEPAVALVTEFMAGGSLHALLHVNKTKLSLQTIWRLAIQMAEGVEFLHSRSPPVVHRDLKSPNLVLDEKHENLKICDFGLTQTLEKSQIQMNGQAGSPRYCAPECFSERSNINEKVDVWAMGCILIELFGGIIPHQSCNNVQQVVANILFRQKPPEIPSHVPPQVTEIIKSCLIFDPNDRISSSTVLNLLKKINPFLPDKYEKYPNFTEKYEKYPNYTEKYAKYRPFTTMHHRGYSTPQSATTRSTHTTTTRFVVAHHVMQSHTGSFNWER
eukprot:GHVL01027920.1.p1 GENE.GHVL01027920.1~~GHVL01027920.1.p1  ORF type:complete len:960 (+),score=178.31 GHVL01027920.1:760-3639(+)